MKTGNGLKKLLFIALIQIIIVESILIVLFVHKAGLFQATDASSRNMTTNSGIKSTDTALGDTTSIIVLIPEAEPSYKAKQIPPVEKSIDFQALRQELFQEKFSLKRLKTGFLSFTATAYDLSFKCCGKLPSDPEYGITFSGTRAVKGRTIAVDPGVIPLGSKVYIEFPNRYSRLNGWYLAEDTGSRVKGEIVDIFFGKSASQEMKEFGRRPVRIRIVKQGDGSFASVNTMKRGDGRLC